MRRGDRGFVTVAVLGLSAVLVAIGALLGTLGTVAVARHRAASAADLAALAGAGHLLDGHACTAARHVARAARAALVQCSVEDDAVAVVVAVRVGRLGTARARARAGPTSRDDRMTLRTSAGGGPRLDCGHEVACS